MRVISCFIVLCACFLPGKCFSQKFHDKDTIHTYFVGSKLQTGYVVTDNSQIASIINKNVFVFQLDYSLLKNTQQSWNYCRCYSKDGISLSYADFGNTKNLGRALSIAIFTEPYLSISKKIQFTLRAGVGISYLNKRYDPITNPDNLTYSRRLSFLLLLNPTLYYALSPRTLLSFGVQFSHISNGGTRWPNWGINFPTAGIGVEYVINPTNLSKRKDIAFTNRNLKIITHIFIGSHSSDHSDTQPEEKKIVTGFNTGLIKPLTRINGLGIGGEIYYDAIAKINETQTGKNYNSIIGALSLQHYFFFKKIMFGQQLAYYVTPLNPKVSSKLYQRYSLMYRVKDPLYIGVSLKSHGGISDYLALAVGLDLSKKK